MHVHKCSTEVKPAGQLVPTFTWAELSTPKAKEGVYKSLNEAHKDVRMIVIGEDKKTIVYYFKTTSVLCSPVGWDNHKFIRTNETVCFELRD